VADTCRARERAENFPVVLRVLPRRQREELHAVYAFARIVDELGDSAPGDRTAQLHGLDEALTQTWAGRPVVDPVLSRLVSTGVVHALPVEPFRDLVRANLADQTTSRYDTFDDLLGYCRLSAVPVGRIVLGVFDEDRPGPTRLSDRVCTALQLLEHWQDVGEDRRAGRVYLPQEDLQRHRVTEADLDRPTASATLRSLMRFEIDRAAEILAEGAPIVGQLRGWARPCVAGFVAGGEATVAALRRTDGDVLGRSARPSRPGTLVRLVALTARGSRGGRR
jgi:squalene synthase HpnC